ncbi:MAG: N-6 DNA methylase [Planctomycetota bacterium]|nr:N-6 DNA methylase [Planctomycetota bacterium]
MDAAARKRGAYFTPKPLAKLLVKWAVRTPMETILDPACGEGIFLAESVSRLLEIGANPKEVGIQITGIDIEPKSLARANGALLSRHPALRWNNLIEEDFFSFVQRSRGSLSFDILLGNPPYIRNQKRTRLEKATALKMAKNEGVSLSAESSLWAPFLATSLSLLRPGGRLAMIVPREAIFVQYAKPLFQYLQNRFASTKLLPLPDYHFSALEKVSLLLCEGVGPGSFSRKELSSLSLLEIEKPQPQNQSSWLWNRIPKNLQPSIHQALSSPNMISLEEIGTPVLGVVTGDKNFFLQDGKTRGKKDSIPGEYLLPVVSKPNQLEGTILLPKDIKTFTKPYLLSIPKTYEGTNSTVNRILKTDHAQETKKRYKCRTRKPWYSIQRVGLPPDGFLGYLVKRRLRCSANMANAQSTNNVHRIYLENSLHSKREVILTSWLNAITSVAAELSGRIYGGGVLKLELGVVKTLPVPAPDCLINISTQEIDQALKKNKGDMALALLDRELSVRLNLPPSTLKTVRFVSDLLRDRRLGIRSTSEVAE